MTGLERLDVLRLALKAEMPKDFSFYFMHFYMKCEPEHAAFKLATCGFSGCALGLAGITPALVAEGLYIDEHESISFKDYKNFHAAVIFFDLTHSEVEWLFGSRSYGKPAAMVTAAEVAARIGMFIVQKTYDTPGVTHALR